MQPEIESAVRNVAAGEFSKVVKTKFGFEIFKVLKRSLIADPRLDAQKDEIRSHLFAEAFQRQFRSWLNQKREDAFVRVNKI
jgi:parvulin-like peptidyl-prolyl isomerase